MRKDNTIAYKGNFYCLPRGTYQGESTKVIVQIVDDYLVFLDQNHNEIIRYKRASGKGKHVGSNNLKRDYSLKIDTLADKLAGNFPEDNVVRDYLEKIRKSNPRYIRDQLVLIEKQIETFGIELMRKAIDFCLLHSIYKATDLEMVARKIQAETNNPDKELPSSFKVKSINKTAFTITPEKSNISDYKNLMN